MATNRLSPLIPGVRIRNACLSLVLLLIAVREGAPIVRAAAGSNSNNAVGAPQVLAGTAFTYQGRLEQDGVPANGGFDLTFIQWDDPLLGTLVATFGPITNVPIVNGLFSQLVDFGLPYSEGKAAWVEVLAKPNGAAGAPVSLGRQRLAVAPHDHLYQDWIGASDSFSLTLRNLGAGGALAVETSAGTALEANSSGISTTIHAANQANGPAIVASAQSPSGAVSVFNSLGFAVSGLSFAQAASCNATTVRCPGVFGQASSGAAGVWGKSTYTNGSSTETGAGYGVFGEGRGGVLANGTESGVYAQASNTNCDFLNSCNGVSGFTESLGSAGVHGYGRSSAACTGATMDLDCFGVIGTTISGTAGGIGVMGKGSGVGVWGIQSGGLAGRFDGSVVITGNLTVSGTISPPTSDSRLKHDVRDLPAGLDEVLALKPVTYAWNAGPEWEEAGHLHNGFLAQDVREVLPSTVYEDPASGLLRLSYDELVPVLTRAIQQQQEEIHALKMTGTPAGVRAESSPWLQVGVLASLAFSVGAFLLVALLLRRQRRTSLRASVT